MPSCRRTAGTRRILFAAVCVLSLAPVGAAHAAAGGVIVFTSENSPKPRHCSKRFQQSFTRGLGYLESVRPDGTGATTLCVSGDGGTITRDGKRLAFLSLRHGSVDIVTADVHGRNERILHRFGRDGGLGNVVWSPTGRDIAFTTGGGLDVIGFPGGRVRKLLSGFRFENLTWSPDGQTIAADERRQTPACGKYETSTDVVAISAAGGAPRTVAANPDCIGQASAYLDAPIWGPPGIALSQYQYQPARLASEVLVDPTGAPVRTLAAGQAPAINPLLFGAGAWSPDGSALVVSRRLSACCSTDGLYMVSAAGGAPVRLGRLRADGDGAPVSWGR